MKIGIITYGQCEKNNVFCYNKCYSFIIQQDVKCNILSEIFSLYVLFINFIAKAALDVLIPRMKMFGPEEKSEDLQDLEVCK